MNEKTNNKLVNRLKGSMSFLQFVESKSGNDSQYAIDYVTKERSWLATLRFHIRMTYYDSQICKLAIERLTVLQDLVESNLAGSFESKINQEIVAIENALQADTVDASSIEAQDKFMSGGILDERGLGILPGLAQSKYENQGAISASNVFRTAHWDLAKDDSSFNQVEQMHHEQLLNFDVNETQVEAEERLELELQLCKSF